MRSDYIQTDSAACILAALMPANRLALLVSLTTGLRIGDVLSLRTEQVKQQRFTIKEQKTGKTRRVYISSELQMQLLKQAGAIFVFEGRLSACQHRTRQAVYNDLKRACKLFRVRGVHVSPHTMRKVYAVTQYQRSRDLAKVQKLLNHSNEAVTMLYAMADELTEARLENRSVHLPRKL